MTDESINNLKSYIAKKGHTQEDAAKLIGCTLWTFNKKLHGRNAEFSRKEMLILIKVYGITKSDAGKIFLSDKCLA